jgi:hypothetical protein
VIASVNPPSQLTPRILSKGGLCIEIAHDAHEGPYYEGQRRYFRPRNYDIPQ